MSTIVILEFDLEHDVSDIADKIANRVSTMQGVSSNSVTTISHMQYIAKMEVAVDSGWNSKLHNMAKRAICD